MVLHWFLHASDGSEFFNWRNIPITLIEGVLSAI
jgi:hypothetical protein